MNLRVENNILYVQTDMDKFSVPELKSQFMRLKKSGDLEGISVIDLEAVNLIDSAGVALLDSFQQALEEDAKLLLTRGAQPKIRSLIDTFSTTKIKFAPIPKPQGFWESAGEATVNFYTKMVAAAHPCFRNILLQLCRAIYAQVKAQGFINTNKLSYWEVRLYRSLHYSHSSSVLSSPCNPAYS